MMYRLGAPDPSELAMCEYVQIFTILLYALTFMGVSSSISGAGGPLNNVRENAATDGSVRVYRKLVFFYCFHKFPENFSLAVNTPASHLTCFPLGHFMHGGTAGDYGPQGRQRTVFTQGRQSSKAPS